MRIDQVGVTIYYKPFTAELEQHLNLKFKDTADEQTRGIEIVMFNSYDKDGNRIWITEEDRDFLRKNVDSVVLADILKRIHGLTVPEAKKNLKRTRS